LTDERGEVSKGAAGFAVNQVPVCGLWFLCRFFPLLHEKLLLSV